MMQKMKNSTLNILKGIACFSVVLLHCSFPGIFGKIIYGIARFAVPLFFAISGYYVYSNDSQKVIQRLPKKIKHIGTMFVGTEILYFLWHCIQYTILTGSIRGAIKWIASSFSFKNLVDFIIFQRTYIGDVSWFLVALILCYIVTFIIAKNNLWEKSFLLIPVLFLINVFLGEIAPFFKIKTEWYWCSNFWLMGFPCYALGFYIKINEHRLVQVLTDKKILAILIFSILLNLIERVLTEASQFFISNILFMFACFIYSIKNPTNFQNKKLAQVLSIIGEKYAFGVYILHPIVRDIFWMIAEYLGVAVQPIWNWILPILVFGMSICIAMISSICKRN